MCAFVITRKRIKFIALDMDVANHDSFLSFMHIRNIELLNESKMFKVISNCCMQYIQYLCNSTSSYMAINFSWSTRTSWLSSERIFLNKLLKQKSDKKFG